MILAAFFISIFRESKSISPNYSLLVSLYSLYSLNCSSFIETALRQNKTKSLDYQRCSDKMRNLPANFINRDYKSVCSWHMQRSQTVSNKTVSNFCLIIPKQSSHLVMFYKIDSLRSLLRYCFCWAIFI